MFIERKKTKELKDKLKNSFSRVKDELEDHLDSINENTNEIQSNYEYLCYIDNKMDKLAERIDEIQYFLEKMVNSKSVNEEGYSLKEELTLQEQELFLHLYTLSDGETLSAFRLSKLIGATQKVVLGYIDSIMAKGVPIKSYNTNKSKLFFLDDKFKAYQTKHKIVSVSDKLIRRMDI